MIPLLIIAGISLGANVVSWYNGRRLREVEAEISALVKEHEQIAQADYDSRLAIIESYIGRIKNFAVNELNNRMQVHDELRQAYDQLNQLNLKGKLVQQHASRMMNDLSKVVHYLAAEIDFLNIRLHELETFEPKPGVPIPAPGQMTLPADYPVEMTICKIHRDLNKTLAKFGKRVVRDETESLDDGDSVLVVMNSKSKVLLSKAGAGLIASYEENKPLRASVSAPKQRGYVMHYQDVELFLEAPGMKLDVGSQVDVFVKDLLYDTVRKIVRSSQLQGKRSHKQLGQILVSIKSPAAAFKRYVPMSFYLKMNSSQLKEIAGIKELTEGDDKYEYFITEDGFHVFQKQAIALVLAADMRQQCFELTEIRRNVDVPPVTCRVEVVMVAAVSYRDIEKTDDIAGEFEPYLVSLAEQLDHQQSLLIKWKNVQSIQKYGIILQDIISDSENKSLLFLQILSTPAVSRTECELDAVLLKETSPSIKLELIRDPTSYRVDIRGNAYRLLGIRWVDSRTGRVNLKIEVRSEDTDSLTINGSFARLEKANSYNPLMTHIVGVNRVMKDAYQSKRIQNTLIEWDMENPTTLFGRESALGLLQDDSKEVVAIWGPPGTGKTSLIVGWLRRLFADSNDGNKPMVLITGPTHVSVDNLLLKLLQESDQDPAIRNEILRFGYDERVDEGISEYNVNRFLETDPSNGEEDSKIQNKWSELLGVNSGRVDYIEWLKKWKHIHAVTCTGIGNATNRILHDGYDIVIVDEAGKAFPGEVMLASSLAMRKLVIIGDHLQLPPTVTEDMLSDENEYSLPIEEARALLMTNFFRQLYEHHVSDGKAMLTVQWRMHPHIGNVVSKMFYEGKLENGKADSDNKRLWTSLNFINFERNPSYRAEMVNFSWQNEEEIKALTSFLKVVQKKGVTFDSIAIICPYKQQKLKVEDVMREYTISRVVEIGTVDSIQGSEADLIILLMTRSEYTTNFLLDRNRLNVALSRARNEIMIFGHKACLTEKPSSPFRQLFDPDFNGGHLNVVDMDRHSDYETRFAHMLE